MTELRTTHTPTPWKASYPSSNFEKGERLIKDVDSSTTIATVTKNFKGQTNHKNAEFIVRACNAHADLVAALTVGSDGVNTVQDHLEEWSKDQIIEHLFWLQGQFEDALAKAKR